MMMILIAIKNRDNNCGSNRIIMLIKTKKGIDNAKDKNHVVRNYVMKTGEN